MEVFFGEFNEEFLELSWKWLNDPEIKFLTNTGVISREIQLEWYKSLPDRKDYMIWGIMAGSLPVGACGLKNISPADCEYWGYLGNKEYWGKGIGKQIIVFLEEKARGMGKTSIWLKVIKENRRAISLYGKQGYGIESEANGLMVMRKQL